MPVLSDIFKAAGVNTGAVEDTAKQLRNLLIAQTVLLALILAALVFND